MRTHSLEGGKREVQLAVNKKQSTKKQPSCDQHDMQRVCQVNYFAKSHSKCGLDLPGELSKHTISEGLLL